METACINTTDMERQYCMIYLDGCRVGCNRAAIPRQDTGAWVNCVSKSKGSQDSAEFAWPPDLDRGGDPIPVYTYT